AHAVASGEISGDVAGVAEADLRAAHELVAADGPVTVVLGRTSVAEHAGFTVDAARALCAIDGVRFLSALRRGNVHGALDMGMAPGLLPGRQDLAGGRSTFEEAWGRIPTVAGLDTTGILQAAADGRLDVLVLVGADPLVDFPDADLADRAIAGARTVIAVDLFNTHSVARADLVLPAAGFAETEGTTTNLEGRVSILRQKVNPPGTARADWMIAAELARRLGSDFEVTSSADLWAQVVALSPAHAKLGADTLAAPENADGLIVAAGSVAAPEAVNAQAAPHDGYGFRLVVDRKLYDAGSQVKFSPSLADLAPGTTVRVAPSEADKLGIDDGTTVSVVSPAGTLRLPLERDDSVPVGIAVVPLAQSDHHAGELIDHSSAVTDIRIEEG
ncbi:MAG: molybdopterin-dependent oxidoreductase, partial [Actinomycetia bacterium]|nr:molybdopterin-dependent oxidoreductase [Actinomycetes bacterium]